jgi:CelD/BcsL family acetyltransferase involved in cellulose biosynthesis
MKLSATQPWTTPKAPVPAVVDARTLGVRFELVDTLEALREDWMSLGGLGQSVFATWEFASTWWEHFGSGRRLLAVRCVDGGGTMFAILPLYLWKRRPLRVIRFVGNGAGDVLGPVYRPEHRAEAAQALRQLLDAPPWDWDVFVGENLPADQGWAGRLGGRVVRREGNPVLRMSGEFEQFLAHRTSNFRRQLRARERRLARRYDVNYRLSSDPERLDDDLDILFRLHEARFGPDSAFGGPRAPFHRSFAHRALERGWLRLWILELDGHPAAAEYGFRFDGAECFYQSGRAAGFERDSLGMAMLANAIRSGVEDGFREFGFGRGHEWYKYRFATEDHGLESLCLVRGRTATAALAVVQAARSSSTVRKALRRPFDM